MGYRYTEDEIERLRRDDNYIKALKVARAARTYIEPSRDDIEAIDFLLSVYLTAEEVNEINVDYYDRGEYVETAIPYNNYKCGMIFAQLGLWYDRMQTTLDQDYIDGIRYILYETALDGVNGLAME